MDYVIGTEDRALFRRCRRAWDFGAQTRQNAEPLESPWALDFARALNETLAVYYFPGMWDWPATVVNPIARQGFHRAMLAQANDLTTEQHSVWESHIQLGEQLLDEYFAWAPTVDDFAPVRVVDDVAVQIPDPREAGRALVTSGGQAIRYQAVVDVLAMDDENRFWVMGHRLVAGGWPDVDLLLLDEEYVAWAWACELLYLGIRVVGTIYNELRLDAVYEARAAADPGSMRSPVSQHRTYPMGHGASHGARSVERVRQESTGSFRRTWVNRGEAELANIGERIAVEALDMADPELPLYPSPSRENCSVCAFRPPCIATNEDLGGDVLGGSYRQRPPPRAGVGRIGGQGWSLGRGAVPPQPGGGR